jgi:UDP-GlcNAc3NAcA epimerase
MSAQKNLLAATVVGARPQFIKAAVVSRALRSTFRAEEVLIHTGQHYDENMSDVFFEELEIPHPDFRLGVGSGSHGAQTGHMLGKLERVLVQEKPDWVLVYGDTNSTLAGALAAAKLHVPVAHVEAGLRSFNRRMPEEINRVLADHASNMLFAPTETAVENLRREGIVGRGVRLVGDVMYDAALYYGAKAEEMSGILGRCGLTPEGYVLATVHRAENTDDLKRLRAIVGGLGMVAEELPVVLPLHPRTRAALAREGLLEKVSRHIRLIEPVGYLDMIMLEKNSRLVATDSGGVQKEAFFYRVPCVTLREETEWVELVESRWNVCVSPEQPSNIYEEIIKQISLSSMLASTDPPSLYGEGNAGGLIAEHLVGANLP